ncbi:MAG: hypothetical protein QOC82_3000 [Frankiaceae bacterium]|jgi:hypothetical protein|nr:hypothetical protein [Frankiaceae bacterium]MDQ1698869.1 hypothetical protein [Frankiaceae bacterium]
MVTLPPKPPGDVAATQAMIRKLQSERNGVVELRKALANLLNGAEDLSGIYMLGVTTFRLSAIAQVDIAITGVDAAIASAKTAVARLEHDLAAWRQECARIQAAASP